MKISIEINDQVKSGIKKSFFKSAVKNALEASDFLDLGKKNISLSIAIVSQEEIKRLNKDYRKKNAVTDILSFSEYVSTEEIGKEKLVDLFLGELVLCYDDIEEYAKKEKIPLEKELANVTIHGVLHLLGLDHGTKMFGLQKEILDNFIK